MVDRIVDKYLEKKKFNLIFWFSLSAIAEAGKFTLDIKLSLLIMRTLILAGGYETQI